MSCSCGGRIPSDRRSYADPVTFAFWVCTVITAISSVVSFGYSVAGLRGASGVRQAGSLYAFSRSLALLAASVVALFVGAVPFTAAVAIAMVTVQAADAVVGVLVRDRFKTVGPAATAVVNLAAMAWMLAS